MELPRSLIRGPGLSTPLSYQSKIRIRAHHDYLTTRTITMGTGFFQRWFAKQKPETRVVLYTRADCPLCDEAKAILERFRERHGFVLEIVDIDKSAEFVREHGNWVPVVAIDGVVRFRGHINEVLLQRLMKN
jgi:glutaredoxin